MVGRIPGYFELDRYNIRPEDVVRLYLGCEPDAVHGDVIITPVWYAGFIDQLPGVTTVSDGRVYEATHWGRPITVIRSGMGAPQTGDVVLALGCTPCQRLVFTGSVGGFRPSMDVGDLLLVEKSISGEGFSRYLSDEVKTQDSFLDASHPNVALTEIVRNSASRICKRESIPLHVGTVFSIDTILAQLFRQEYLANELRCIGIEMETSATFNAARLVGIQVAALLQVSDLPMAGKSLFSGRTAEEGERRRLIRRTVLAEALLDSLAGRPVS